MGGNRLPVVEEGLEASSAPVAGTEEALRQAERERLAVLLHDGPLQDVIAAQQDLDEHAAGDPEALALAQEALQDAVSGMRRLAAGLYEPDGASSVGALQAACVRLAERGGFHLVTIIERRAMAPHGALVADAVLELVRNAAKHADADHVLVLARRAGDTTAIEVRDDGVGTSAASVADAARASHLGLRALARRTSAAGGRMELGQAPGGGTRVRLVVPDPAFVPPAGGTGERHAAPPPETLDWL